MSVRRVDPGKPHNRVERALIRFGRSRLGIWYGINLAARLDPWLMRHSGGRLRLVFTLPTVLLGTTGAKSGASRVTPVLYFHDGDDVILVASSFGRDRHPGWYYNLAAHPDCTLNGEAWRAVEVSDPAERRRLLDLAESVYQGYRDYQERTAAIGRQIPVLRLTAVA